MVAKCDGYHQGLIYSFGEEGRGRPKNLKRGGGGGIFFKKGGGGSNHILGSNLYC